MKKIKLWNPFYDPERSSIVAWNNKEYGFITFPKNYTANEADAFKAGWNAAIKFKEKK